MKQRPRHFSRGVPPAGFHRTSPRSAPKPIPAFGITVFDEHAELLKSCLIHIRAVYPQAPVFVICDGRDAPEYRSICGWYHVEYYVGERLKLLPSGAAWWHRFFSFATRVPADYVFKTDPDTQLHRRFRSYPPLDVFGSLDGSIIQGGIQGFSAGSAMKIHGSRVCLDPSYREYQTWAHDEGSRHYALSKGQISTDYILSHIVRRLGLRSGAWDEVDSMWQPTRPFRDGVAATHPHKLDITKPF